MKNNKKGITLIVLVITIVVGLILAVAGITAVSSAITDATKAAFAEELKVIEDEVSMYYLQNNEYPGVLDVSVNDFRTYSPKDIYETIFEEDDDKFTKIAEEMNENKENGDEEITKETETKAFYVIDLDKLNLDRKTRGTKYNEEKSSDVYIVSANTNKVYYLKGVKTGGETYFSLNKLMNYVDKSVTSDKEGDVEVKSVGSLTVKRLKKTWTNTLGITLNIAPNTSGTLGNISTALKAGDVTLATTGKEEISQNVYTINSLDDLPGANFSDDDKANFAKSQNKKIVFTKGEDTLEVDVSNYDVNAPTYDDIDTWTVTQTNEENVIEFDVKDDVSGVKEIRYAYLKKYGKEGDVENYYKNVENLEASFIKARGKKAEISEEGHAVLKVPRDIEAIQMVVIDKAGNYPVDSEDGNPIKYGIKADYIGCSLESINNNGLTFNALFNSTQTGNYISNYSVNVSIDGKAYDNTNEVNKTVDGNNQVLKDLVEDYKTGIIEVTDKVYVKIKGTFENTEDSTIENNVERIFEFSLNEDISNVTVKEVPTVGETLTLSVENPKEGATYYWTDMEDTLNVEGTELTLNEAEVIGYEGKQLYYIEKIQNKITTSDLYVYRVNYDISTPEQMIGIYKILSENVTYSQDTDNKVKTLEGKTIRMLNDIDMTKYITGSTYDGNSVLLYKNGRLRRI